MRAPAPALTPFEITVGGGGAALAGLKPIGIHRQAHGTARFAPFKTRVEEYLVQAFLLRLFLHSGPSPAPR